MTVDTFVVLALGLVVGMLSINLPRALLWVVSIVVIYLFTNWYWSTGLPIPAYIAAVLDALLVVEILRSTNSKKERWQFWTALIVQSMVAVNLVYLYAGHLLNVGAYHQLSLEVLNYTALIVIGGTAISEKIGRHGSDLFSNTFHNFRAFMRTVLPQGESIKGQ